jgi:hypothetical protein
MEFSLHKAVQSRNPFKIFAFFCFSVFFGFLSKQPGQRAAEKGEMQTVAG